MSNKAASVILSMHVRYCIAPCNCNVISHSLLRRTAWKVIDYRCLLFFKVCTNVAQCYAVASQFEGCREKIQENASIIRDLVRILYYKVSVDWTVNSARSNVNL